MVLYRITIKIMEQIAILAAGSSTVTNSNATAADAAAADAVAWLEWVRYVRRLRRTPLGWAVRAPPVRPRGRPRTAVSMSPDDPSGPQNNLLDIRVAFLEGTKTHDGPAALPAAAPSTVATVTTSSNAVAAAGAIAVPAAP